MMMSRPRKGMQHDVIPMVILETQIIFLFKTTDATNDENTNLNDGFCSEYFVYEGENNDFLCFESNLQVSKWGIITALQCLMSRLYSGTVCAGEPKTSVSRASSEKNVNRNILISEVYIYFVSNVNIVPTDLLDLKLLPV